MCGRIGFRVLKKVFTELFDLSWDLNETLRWVGSGRF